MRSYETLIMEILKGETPKQKYDFLNFLLTQLHHRTQAMEEVIMFLDSLAADRETMQKAELLSQKLKEVK